MALGVVVVMVGLGVLCCATAAYVIFRLVGGGQQPELSEVEHRLLDAVDDLQLRVDALSKRVEDQSDAALQPTSSANQPLPGTQPPDLL